MIKRSILPQLISHLDEKEITMLIGPRQSGKTTLLGLLSDHLKGQGKKTLYLNLDLEDDIRDTSSQQKLIQRLKLGLGDQKGYVFIDEIQRKENAGIFLKGIYDTHSEFKFIVSGSGSMELKEKISESLAGRKRVFEIETLSFEEFFNYKTGYEYEGRVKEYLDIELQKAQNLLEEYLNFGGYPKVVLADTAEEKIKNIDEIYTSYLLKDITELLDINKPDKFKMLANILANQIGNILNYNEISNTLDIADDTLKKYLWYMQQTFVVDMVTPFYTNKRTELVKSPIFYFHDLGLRNYIAGEIGRVTLANSIGFVFENFIYILLKPKIKFTPNRINFWRTKSGAEVDFVIDRIQDKDVYEVKYKNFNDQTLGKSMISFISKYSPKWVSIIGLNSNEEKKVESTTVKFISWKELL
jgi:predicted AAA+ superfamily ATPase